MIANYIKIKRDESMRGYLTMAVEGNWILEEWEEIENVGKRIRKLREEIEERSDEDNVFESKMTWDCCLPLQPSERLKTHLSCKGGLLE